MIVSKPRPIVVDTERVDFTNRRAVGVDDAGFADWGATCSAHRMSLSVFMFVRRK